MKTTLLPIVLAAIHFFLSYNIPSVNAQIENRHLIQEDFICIAPIDPSWLQSTKEVPILSRALEEPTVRVAYLIPSNRSPQAKGVEALQLIIRTARDFFREQMVHNGLEPKTLRYETEADGETPLIHVVNIPETDVEIEANAWSNKINAARNAGLGVWQRGEIWILVSESHVQQPDGSIRAGGALGNSLGTADDPGVATMTSTFLTPLAQGGLTDDRAYHGMLIPEIGPYPLIQGISFQSWNRSTMSAIASVTVGAFWHELMHAFGIIPHDFRNDANFHGNLMGNGFRGIRGTLYPDRYSEDYTRLAFASAHVLNTSHYFNTGQRRNLVEDVSLSLHSSSPQDGQLLFNVDASDADGLSLLRMIGFPDFNSVELVLSGNNFNGRIATPYFEPGTSSLHRLIVYDSHGNKVERVIDVTPKSGNRAPRPFVRILPPIGEAGDTFGLNWEGSFDPDTGSEVNSSWDIAWDLDNDDIFDVVPTSSSPTTEISLPAGNHLIRLKLTEPSGAQTVSTPVALHVAGDPPPPTEVSFTLIDASTNQAIPGFDPISEGAEINLYTLPKRLSIRANVPAHYESVRFDYDGEAKFRVENFEPYALFGDLQGDYIPGMFSIGTHTLSASPFSKDNANGASGIKGILHFSVVKRSVSFVMVDADTDQELFSITDGMVIDQKAIKGKNINIKTSHELPLDGLSVHFSISSFDRAINRIWTEHFFPYALFGDIDGDYGGAQFPTGKYHMLVVFDYGENPGFEVEPSIELNFEIIANEILAFSATNEVGMILEEQVGLKDGRVYANEFPFDGKTFIFVKNSKGVGSVFMELSGPITYSRIENGGQSHSLFGGNTPSRAFPEGEYELTATPYTKPDKQGFAGKSLTVSFFIQSGFILNSLKLVNAEDSTLIDDLLSFADGFFVNVDEVTNATVLVEYDCVNGLCPGSVSISLDGPLTSSRIENTVPFALFGDINGALIGRAFLAGDYSIRLTPYSEANGMGLKAPIPPLPIRIINNADRAVASSKITTVYPNPASNAVFVKTDENNAIYKTVILDFSGRVVKQISSLNSEQSIDVSGLNKGIYFVKIETDEGIEIKKLVVQ